MITTQIKVFEEFDRVTEMAKTKARVGLNAAAVAAKGVGDQRSGSITSRGQFQVIPAQPTANGFASGVRGNPLVRIFDKGTLGKRSRPTKRSRKDTWQVTRKGTTYTAHRRDIGGKGIAARNILGPARAAGRKALLAAVRR